MLLNLHVKNLALIDESEVEFTNGLNILSGETGAGKSIIIGSINIALGEKVKKELLRENAPYALVELVFDVESPSVIEALEEMDIYPEDGIITLSRKIMNNGRSVCRINSESVSVGVMRNVASLLIDIHGQHEHQSLLTKKNHIKYLDSYAGEELEVKLSQIAEVYKEYTSVKRELEECSIDDERQHREISFLEYEINEIDEAELISGEDEQLEIDFKKFSNARKIMDAASVANALCAEDNGCVSDNIGRALKSLLDVAEYDETASSLADQLAEIENLVNDFNRDLSGYISDFDISDEAFEYTRKRLDLINHLKSKYGKTIDDILEARDERQTALDKLHNIDAYRAELENKLNDVIARYEKLSTYVTSIRKVYANKLTENMIAALKDLNFLDVKLELEFTKNESFTASGQDNVVFMISTNPGEPLKPLDSVASGGELSRIMLALKTVLAEADDIDSLIFDEIDAGISGRTAQMVAQKIKQTASNHQVICITHLPQIAAMADSHFLIEKTSDFNSTVSNIRMLKEDESIHELARMLGGVKITDTVLESAKEMREMAKSFS